MVILIVVAWYHVSIYVIVMTLHARLMSDQGKYASSLLLTNPMRKRGVNRALQELVDEVDDVVEGPSRKRRRKFEDNKKEEG